jgi:quinolinate synthase
MTVSEAGVPGDHAGGVPGDHGGGGLGDHAGGEWAAEVRRLARERDAVILAHNYQLPEIQDVADHVGDSLALSRIAASSPASVIVFAGVYFMAETAKILSPGKTVLIPDQRAGCSLADSITAAQLREWKAGHPGAVVVAYVNTSAEVKAEADVCCTSANAAEVVNSIPAGREVLFCPDQFLGAHVRRVTGRKNLHIWAGECHVHAAISGHDLAAQVAAEPDAELFIHPECGCATSALYLASQGLVPAGRVRVLSTGGMLTAAQQAHQAHQSRQAKHAANKPNHANKTPVLVATEVGMLHQLRRAAPEIDFRPVNDRASCRYMKMITPAALLRSLREGQDVVDVPADVARRARAAVRKMISTGKPGGAE